MDNCIDINKENDHDCFYYEEIILCDGEQDLWKCNVYGKEWIKECNYPYDHDF